MTFCHISHIAQRINNNNQLQCFCSPIPKRTHQAYTKETKVTTFHCETLPEQLMPEKNEGKNRNVKQQTTEHIKKSIDQCNTFEYKIK